ncbi:class A beta-lactamase [Reyranella sp.]|jgi:beta-lactamase class A|uniref:class A beta-lactamase n=1 Tax=Reyranella sp. TaxID=1929291 RepID=UPI002F9333DA
MIDRRNFLAALMLAGIPGPCRAATRFEEELKRLEAGSGGRLGVALLDGSGGRMRGWRGGERFPMCSTFKVLAAAALLHRVDAGQERLDRRVTYAKADLASYSPVTAKHVGTGLTLGQLCEAAITLSDNTAANLLLANIGGPAGLTAFAAGLGDHSTRLDRTEPTLNEALPGDPRDTTTPDAMAVTLSKLVLGSALAPASREQLAVWMIATRTGDARLRAGLPHGWRIGDKTGSGEHGTANDIAVIWPVGRAPVIVTVYLTGATGNGPAKDAVIADVGRAVVSALG